MKRFAWVTGAVGVACCMLCSGAALAQKVAVSILYRQNSDAVYTAVIPGYSSTADAAVDCAADGSNDACSSQARSLPAAPAPSEFTLSVIGTTVSVALPDGRVAVLNCVNRYSPRGTSINRRSCAMPLVAQAEADFDGLNARLKWPVGQDGKKTESETYKVIAFLEKR